MVSTDALNRSVFAEQQRGYFDSYISQSPAANADERTLFGLMYAKNVVRYAMFAEALFLLPVALAHVLTPSISLQPMLRDGVKVNDVGSMITRWYGVNCLAISIFGILCSTAANNNTGRQQTEQR